MSTPLLKGLRGKGTTFYAFPSTSANPNPDFNKFVLINIPAKKDDEILDFDKSSFDSGIFDIYTQDVNPTNSYADQMIESLRNYCFNHDTVMRESRISSRKEFYNIEESKTPTEKIFWKWLRKMGAMDFEPATHKVDWDKNLSDFDNNNADVTTNTDYFRKYLWKEREVIDYTIESITYLGATSLGTSIIQIYIDYPAKFKVGDYVVFSGETIGDLSIDESYEVLDVEYELDSSNLPVGVRVSVNETLMNYGVLTPDGNITLDYNRVVQYIGEINVKSEVHTASKDETEITAYVPHQAGKTPSILFEIDSDTNYYPGLEMPIMADEIQVEIKGAENLNSPIRQNPSEYPGLYYGQFDTLNKTYTASMGDKLRYSGKYYGIDRNNNVGLSAENYVELLSEFNADKIDGLCLDFDLTHYLKMSIVDESVGFNFDEFNQISIDDEAPEDFEYNAVLWYYENENLDGTVSSSLYGITFLNNPDNDDDSDGTHISTYEKLVNTEEHDGLSYQHVLNLSTSVDNDTSSLAFDPLTLNNTFGFDLYSNVMSNVGKLNESFVTIINEFVKLNVEMNNMRSLIYTQTDIDLIKNKLKNLEELLKLYKTMQFVETDSVKIDIDYSGIYPTLGFNVKSIEYKSVVTMTSSDIYKNKLASSKDVSISIPETNKLFVRVTNDDVTDYTFLEVDLGIVLSNDLEYKQGVDMVLDAKNARYPDKLNIYINYDDGTTTGPVKTLITDNVYLPIDIGSQSGDIIYHKNKYMNESISQNVTIVSVSDLPESENNIAFTTLYTDSQNVFGTTEYNEYVYINNFMFLSGDTILDYSGVYEIINSVEYFNQSYIKIILDTYQLKPVGVPKIYSYKGLNIKILRVDESETSTITDRYLIEKRFI